MKRVTLVHMLSSAQVGGSEKQAVMLLEGLDPARFEPSVIVFRPGPLEAKLRALARVVVLDKRRKVDAPFFVRLVLALRWLEPDIVHTWDSTANLWGGLASRVAGVPHHVVSEGELDLWKGPLWHRLDRRLGRWADAVVGNSAAITEACAARGVDHSKLRTIHNGVSIPGSTNATQRDPDLIVLVGRIHPRKGHHVLIRALPRVRAARPDARVVFVGGAVYSPEPEYEEDLRRLVAELSLDAMVEFAGHSDRPTEMMRRAGVVVVPSYSEGLPNVVLEAMSVGTPVVATSVGGTPEAIEDRMTGLLVPPDDPGALADAIIETLTDPAATAQRVEAARSVVRDAFSPPALVDAWTSLYEIVLRPKFADASASL